MDGPQIGDTRKVLLKKVYGGIHEGSGFERKKLNLKQVRTVSHAGAGRRDGGGCHQCDKNTALDQDDLPILAGRDLGVLS